MKFFNSLLTFSPFLYLNMYFIIVLVSIIKCEAVMIRSALSVYILIFNFFSQKLYVKEMGPKKQQQPEQEKLTRIAIVSTDKCKPKRCRQECKKSCPVVRMGKLCIEVTTNDRYLKSKL